MTTRRQGEMAKVETPGEGVAPEFASLLSVANGRAGTKRLAHRMAIVLAVAGVATLLAQASAVLGPDSYKKDFKQEYLLARAILDGRNPYVQQAELAERYLPLATPHVQAHPVPHPPLVALVAVPLGLIPYRIAAAIWLALELVLLFLLVYMLGKRPVGPSTFRPTRKTVLIVTTILLLWPPVAAELRFGQLSLILAVLLVCWAIAMRADQERLAGMLLGLAAGIKLFPIVLAGYLLLRRQWRATGWAVATFVATFAVALPVIGVSGMKSYLLDGLAGAASWRADEGNYSALSFGWRIFAGSPTIEPILDLEWAALPTAIAIAIGIAVWTARVITRADDRSLEMALAMCSLVVLTPVVWQYYLVLLVWPLWIALTRPQRGAEATRKNELVTIILLLTIPPAALSFAASALSGLAPGSDTGRASMLAAVPFLALPLGPLLFLRYMVRSGSCPDK